MIEHATLFVLSSAILGAMAAGFLAWTTRLSAGARPYGYAVVLACGSMSAAYLLMSMDLLTVETTGRTESAARFLGYTVAWAAVCFVVGGVTDADRRYLLALLATILGCLWGTFASWILGGVAGTVVSIGIFASLAGMAYVLFRPLTRAGRTVGGDRALLYAKLRNLVVLVFAGLLLTGAISEQNLGLTDAFVGQTVATYVDLVWLAGFGGLVFRYEDDLVGADAPSLTAPGDGSDERGDAGLEAAD